MPKKPITESTETTVVHEASTERDEQGNVRRRVGFDQVCVLEATETDGAADFEQYVKMNYGVEIQFLEEFRLASVRMRSGGPRHDVFFAIDGPTATAFSAARERDENSFAREIRWLEDVLLPFNNVAEPPYPPRVFHYVTQWPEIGPGLEALASPRPADFEEPTDPERVPEIPPADPIPPREVH